MGLSGVEPLTSRLSGVRSNHLSYRPSPPPHPPPLHDATTPRRKRGNTPFVQLSVVASYDGPHSQSRRGPGPFFGRNSSSSSSSNSSSRSSYSSRSSRSSSSSSSSSRSLSSSKSPNCSSPRLSPRRLSDQSDVSRDNIVTPS